MHNITVFAEDLAHLKVIRSFISRLAGPEGSAYVIDERNGSGGKGRAFSELKLFVRDLVAGFVAVPDLLIVGIDANCKTFAKTQRDAEQIVGGVGIAYVLAIPDPHIERWLLLDARAFKHVFGRGCQAPDQKCERNRYKNWLRKEIEAAGHKPPLGGIEYADDIISHIEIDRIDDASLKRFVEDLRRALR